MELLLNLAWLLLALPAYWLWRGSASASARRRFTSLQCLLALGCLLVMLFPVVSATDDLHAMRAEMEESPLNKRSICQKADDRPSSSKWQNHPALVLALISFFSREMAWHSQTFSPVAMPSAPSVLTFGRGPPAVA